MLPDKITQIFGFRLHKKLRGKLQTVLEKVEHRHHVFRACGQNAVLRMYEKFTTFLRLEALSNNLKDFGRQKSLDNLAAVREKLSAATDRLVAFEAEALNVFEMLRSRIHSCNLSTCSSKCSLIWRKPS